METDFEQDAAPLSYYLEIARRRLPLMAAVAVVIFLAAVIVSVALPPMYQSKATILVESQQIPSDLIKSTVTGYAEERIEVLRQQVMTRDNLLDIVNKYNLFRAARQQASPTDLVEKLRSRIAVEKVNTSLSGRGNSGAKSAIAFSITYEDKNPVTAQKVAEELVNLFLNKNVTTRTQRAEDTTIFLGDQAKDLDRQVTATERKIAAYKAQYKDSLPENLGLNRSSLEQAQRDLDNAQSTERSLQQQITYLRLGSRSLGSTDPSGGGESLSALKARLSSMMGTYGSAHPDVIALKRRIAAIEARPDATAEKNATSDTANIKALADSGDPSAIRLAAQLASNEAELEDIKNTETKLRAKITDLQHRIEQTPQVQQGLLQMQRDYDNALAKYREIKSKELEAQVAQNLEEEQKAERFTMLERPIAPDRPTKPNRVKIILLGFMLSLAGGAGSGVFAESVDRKIRGRRTLERLIGQPLLGTVPILWTDGETRKRQKRIRLIAGAVVAALIVAVIAVHFLVMPLDIAWLKLVRRFGG
jgi:polysaccharide chain length determinant protein (PEP-CTERM system associated)